MSSNPPATPPVDQKGPICAPEEPVAPVPPPTAEEILSARVQAVLGDIAQVSIALREVTVQVPKADYLKAAEALRDAEGLRFDTLIDLCGMDYSTFGEGTWQGARFAVVTHLLSVSCNQRLRLKVFGDDDHPVVPSLTAVWPAAGWYEREAFDLFGIIFEGHDDLRRILTDYGFIGHPFRKDFPTSGYVEMRYDPEQRRVIYQPVTIEPRDIIPRVIREANYARD